MADNMKWNRAGLHSNLIGGNADNVVRAIVSNPELIKEFDDDQLNTMKELLKNFNPGNRQMRKDKSQAQAFVNTVIGDRVRAGSEANFDGGEPVETIAEGEQSGNEESGEEPQPVNSFEQAAEVVEQTTGTDATSGKPVASGNGNVKPDNFGNTKKGERICSNCGISEAETLKKNPRYSFCKGMCVHCYNKVARKGTGTGTASTTRGTKDEDMTKEQLEARIAFLTGILNKKRELEAAAAQAQTGGTSEGETLVTEGTTVNEVAPESEEAASEELAEVVSEQ